MCSRLSLTVLALAATPLFAEETRQLDAHEHGVGQLDMAIDGNQISIALHAPGADIVGFEYAAESAQDRAAVDAAVAALARPLDLFILPTAAACSVTQASASLETEAADVEEEHEDHAHDDGHDDHDDVAGHTEFHAEYMLDCANPSAVMQVTFAYFDTFPNAQELEVQVLSETGVKAFEVERDAPTLDLRGMF